MDIAQKYPAAWKPQILDAMKNTDSINFIVDDMDIFGKSSWFDPEAIVNTHWEMDQIIQRGYTDKLQLWNKGVKMDPEDMAIWIQRWTEIRNLP
jgi:hypothetical protein